MVAVAMKKSSALLLLASLLGSMAFYPLAGPSFYNGSDTEVDMDIVYQDGPCCHLAHVAAHHFAFAEPKPHEVKTITVTTFGKTYQFGESDAGRQRTDVKPKDQLWVFDGAHICMIRKRDFDDEKKGLQRPAP